MKQKIISLAKEKGFEVWLELPYIDNADGRTYYHEPHNDERAYYLWLCELQKWLIDHEDLHVEVFSYNHEMFTLLISKYEEVVKQEIWKHKGPYDERIDALEKGCYEALKLID